MALAEKDLSLEALEASAPSDVQFEAIYKGLKPGVTCLVRRYIKDPARTEDLVQETFLRAERLWTTTDPPAAAWQLVRTIAERLCIDAWRAEEARPEITVEDPSCFEELVEEGSDPHDHLAQSMLVQGINEVLDGLDPCQRRILLMKDLDGRRYSEIAELEGAGEEALRSVVSRTRERFRQRYLAVARRRGLPALAPVGFTDHLRAWRRRWTEPVAGWLRQLQVFPSESIGAAGAAQLSNALLALALVVAGAVAGEAGASHSSEAGSPTPVPLAAAQADVVVEEAVSSLPVASSGVEAAGAEEGAAEEGEDEGRQGLISGNETLAPFVPEERPVEADPRDVTDPNRNVANPEDVKVTSIEFSPTDERVIYLAGHNRACPTTPSGCPAVLLRSGDGGSTWTRLEAEGFDGTSVLLPPAHGAGDDRIFAMSMSEGLQISENGGATFRSAAPGGPAAVGPATISPGFNSGDPRIIVGASGSLVQYRDDTRSITPAPYSAAPGSLEPAFASEELLLAGGRVPDEKGRLRTAVFRCAGSICSGLAISETRVAPRIRVVQGLGSSDSVYAFTRQTLHVSTDGGRSFEDRRVPHLTGDLVDLAQSALGGELTLFAAVDDSEEAGDQGLHMSHDGGSSWERLVDPLLTEGVMAVRDSGERVVAARKGGGLACSLDGGRSWAPRC